MTGGLGRRATRLLAPLAVGILFLAAWEAVARFAEIPSYIRPAPSAIAPATNAPNAIRMNRPSLK